MLNQMLIIAAKEMTDSWRDRRSMLSTMMYSLMGLVVVSLVSMAVGGRGKQPVLAAMMSVFTMVSAFVGGMNVAMDCVAGERERRSLLPLLMHPVTRFDVLLGKWLAVAAFSVVSLSVNVLAFALLLGDMPAWPVAACLLSLPCLAAALQVWVSTVCRGVREANTYLSMLVFLPMGVGMFTVFSPITGHYWWGLLPIAGQQLQLEVAMKGGEPDAARIAVLILATAVLACLALLAAASRLEQDDAVYGD
jgi:sodium transport system permease protein